jgi:ArsR family transcriptional regulator, arsenate/arsenite/antimonite-responsive transcriptional repressor
MRLRMALARVENFPDKDLKIADFAKALSHPARIAILKVLAEKNECICGELAADLPLAQSTVSQHLKALKEIGLIRGTIDGPRSRYCIDWKVYERMQREMTAWSEKMLKLRQDNCC